MQKSLVTTSSVPLASGASVVNDGALSATIKVDCNQQPLMDGDITDDFYVIRKEKKSMKKESLSPALNSLVLKRNSPLCDEQNDSKDAKLPTVLTLLKGIRASQRLSPGKIFPARLVGLYGIASGANTTLNSVQSCSPIGVQDWTGFQALFDECRVTSMRVRLRATFSPIPATQGEFGLAYDPANVGVYTNLSDVVTAERHIGPCPITGSTALSSPQTAQSGYYEMIIKTPATRLTSDGASATTIGGGWFGTSSTTLTAGYLKAYCPAMGAGVVSNYVVWIEYFCNFRNRT